MPWAKALIDLSPYGVFIVALANLGIAYWEKQQKNPRMAKYFLGFGLFGIFCAILTILGQATSKRESAEQQKQLTAKQEQIADLTNRIFFQLTGGNSFCYYELGFDITYQQITGKRDVVSLTLVLSQPCVLHDLNIIITDETKQAEYLKATEPPINSEKMKEFDTVFRFPLLRGFDQSNWHQREYHIRLPPDRDLQRYRIVYSALNGSWQQVIILRKVNGRWTFAHKISLINPDHTDTEVHRYIAHDFPKEVNGEVYWGYDKD